MSKTRVISRIDIKNENVIKGIQFDGLRKLGDPNQFARKYYTQGADEIIFMDNCGRRNTLLRRYI